MNITKNMKEVMNKRYPIIVEGKVISHLTAKAPFKSGAEVKYILECSICSKDSELFPYGSITSNKAGLSVHFDKDGNVKRKMRVPCGCAPSPKWTEEQNKIRVERKSKLLGYVFTGFWKYKGDLTKFSLYNPETSNTFPTTLGKFLNTRHIDPVLGRVVATQKSTTPLGLLLERFHSKGNYLPSTIFKPVKLTTVRGLWEITCPVCSQDEFVKSNICSGKFYQKGSEILAGSVSCRCSDTYHYSLEQRKFQIEKRCKDLDMIPDLPEDWSKNDHFKVTCKKGHTSLKTVSNFIRKSSEGTKCPVCNRGSGGYDPSKAGTFYVFRWTFGNTSYLKFGITNHQNHMIRINQQRRLSKLEPSEVFTRRFEDGEIPLKLEHIAKSELFCGVCPSELLQDGFTETVKDTSENLSFLTTLVRSGF